MQACNKGNIENIDPTSSYEYGSVFRSDSFEMLKHIIFEDPLKGDTVTTELQDPSEPVVNDSIVLLQVTSTSLKSHKRQ